MRQEEADKLAVGDWVIYIFSSECDAASGIWTEQFVVAEVATKPLKPGRLTIRPTKRGEPYGKARSVHIKNVRDWNT